jgi:hypothetical protein
MSITASELQKNKIRNGEITSFFDCLTDILLKYSGGELIHSADFKKHFSSFMLCRYLSMKESLIEYAEYLNLLQTTLTAEQMYLLAYKLIPKQKTSFIKYLKKPKKEEEIEETFISENINNNMKLFDL